MKRNYIFLGFFIWIGLSVQAQQEGMFSQYMYNPSAINPGYTGSADYSMLYFQYRDQWSGANLGSPRSFYFNYQRPGMNKLSLGTHFMQERVGTLQQLSAGLDISYKLKLSAKETISIGIRPMFDYLDVDFSGLNIYNPQDPWFNVNINRRMTPNVGFGLFYYTDKTYVGISSSGLLQSNHFDDGSSTEYLATYRPHYYMMAGTVLSVGEDILLRPSFLIRYVEGVPLHADISLTTRVAGRLEAGLSYRVSGDLSALLSFRVKPNILFGYSYDTQLGDISDYVGASNEFFIRYEFLSLKKAIVRPRFF